MSGCAFMRSSWLSGKDDCHALHILNTRFLLDDAAIVCVFCFIIGLIFCTGAGEYWLKMFDSFAGTIGLVVIALMETISVIYIYGHEKYDQIARICSPLG